MKIAIILTVVVAATLIEESSAGFMGNMMDKNPMVAALLPPGCKEAINGAIDKGKKTYKWLTEEKCDKVCKGIPITAKLLWPHKSVLKATIKETFDHLKNDPKDPLDIDKICPDNIKYADIDPLYETAEKKCIKGVGEFDNNKDLCHCKKEDFPKTQKCVEDMATSEFKKRTNPLPLECAKKALDRYCTKTYIDKVVDFFFNTLRKNLKHKEFPKGNPWWIVHQFFDVNKCSGKL